jgi:hypothetical protein
MYCSCYSNIGCYTHPFMLPPPLLIHARTVAAWSQSPTTGAPPPRRRSSPCERSPGHTVSRPSRRHPRGKPLWPIAAVRPSSGEPLPSTTVESTMELWTGHPCTVHRPVDRVHHLFPLENNSKTQKSLPLYKEALYLFDINPQSTYLQEAPRIFKNNSKYSPSHFQKLQIGPYNFFLSYLCNSDSKSSDSCVKILRITSSFILCIHLIYVRCLY